MPEKDSETTQSEKSQNGNQGKVPFYKLFSFADRLDIVLMIGGTIGAMGNGMSQPLITVILGKLINTFGGSNGQPDLTDQISKVCVNYAYLAIGSSIASFLQMSCWMVSGQRQATRIRSLYLKTILRQDISFFDTQTRTGEVIERMSGDTMLIQEAMGEKVGKFIQFTTTFFGGFIIGIIMGWQLALVLCCCIPPLVAAGRFMALVMSKMSSLGQMAYADAGNVLQQTVGAIRTVASFTGEKQAIKKYDDKLQVAYESTSKQGLVSGLGHGTILLMSMSVYGLAIYYGSRLVLTKAYRGGTVINVMLAIIIGGTSLGQTSPCLNAFAAGQAAAYKMFETIKRVPLIDAYDKSGIVLQDLKGEIDLRDVYFKYPARQDVRVLAGFTLHVPSGTTAALVGHSGSGKSTVISLLQRFYDPEAGEVLIDGVNIKTMQIKWLRDKMGLVSQEPVLFATSIKENILYGKACATDSEIRIATELANATKFIDKLPQGLDTMVGEHGAQLSGGQKQRIAIARAILKDPRILLLDEATSALDVESEYIVQDALDKVMTNRTTVVVAHRLTTIRNAHIIAVVNNGKIVEQGTHSEMIKDSNGAYYQLVRTQDAPNQDKGKSKELDTKKSNASIDVNDNLNRSPSQSTSPGRSTSRGSSRHSSTLNLGVPGQIGIHGAEIGENTLEINEADSRKHEDVSFSRLFKLNKPELPYLLLGSFAACAHGAVFPIFGLLLSKCIRIFFEPPHELRKGARVWSLMFVGLGIVTVVFVLLQYYLFGVAGGRLIQRIRSLSFQRVVHQEISWFDAPANSSGAVGARLSADASAMRSLVGDALALVIQNLSTVVTALVLSFTANWILAFTIVAVLPFIGLEGFLHTKFFKNAGRDSKVMYEEASQVANDAISSIRTVASFCAEVKVMDIYEKKCEAPRKLGVKQGIISGFSFGLGSSANSLATAFYFWIGARLVEHEKASFGDVFKVLFPLTFAATGISQSTALAPDFNKAKNSVASIFKILDSKAKIDSSSNDGQVLATVKGDIELQHIRFKYPTRPDIQIFKDLCLFIPSGKTVALAGESGSGKSTVISLIERFYDPDSGDIYLDGVEIRKLKLNWLRQQIGLVGQEPVLFNETIRTNIAYGKAGDVIEEEIIAAAKAANAHNFISGLPQGYDTCVGERGVQLSGGQKQRIAIARAIIKDPRILLLDEATSALDAESESIVQDALDKVTVNRTTLVVAHRLSTIKGADIIAVVKDGVIAEQGGHNTLMNIPGGVYASLVALHLN